MQHGRAKTHALYAIKLTAAYEQVDRHRLLSEYCNNPKVHIPWDHIMLEIIHFTHNYAQSIGTTQQDKARLGPFYNDRTRKKKDLKYF